MLGTASYTTSSKNVGSYTIGTSGLYSVQQGYDISYGSGTANIGAATLTVSGATAANKPYDGTTSATVSGANLSGVVNGDSVTLGQSGTFSDKNVGNGKTVTETFALSGTDAGNYVLASSTATTTANIYAANLAVTANNASKTADGVAYNGGNGVQYSGFVNGETSNVLGGNLVYGGAAQGAAAAGTYRLSAGGLSASNYALTYLDGSLVINAAPATTDNTQLSEVQQSVQVTPPGTTPTSSLALASATSRALDVQSCGMRLPDGMVCH